MSTKGLIQEYNIFIDSLRYLEQTCNSKNLSLTEKDIINMDNKDTHELLQTVKSGNASIKKVINTYKFLNNDKNC